jgi:hypothetical protein
MSDPKAPASHEPLQFERASPISEQSPASRPAAAVCIACHSPIATEYFQINGKVVCGRCRQKIEWAADTPRGIAALASAAGLGLIAAVSGAAIYYAVLAYAHLEIGIVAILIGYMVGYAVRVGTNGRGGLRYQVLAVVLTYGSVALAYAPFAFQGAEKARSTRSSQSPSDGGSIETAQTARAGRAPSAATVVVGLGFLAAFIAALPVLAILSTLPGGLISGFIIGLGMRQAWRMTGAPRVDVLGPYRIGAAATPA